MRAPRFLLLLLIALPAGIVQGREAAPAADDPVLEKRVMDLASELRCLVCQNQTIADSAAPLAVDLRGQIREQLKGGASEQDVIDYMVARYGDFVRYRPPFEAKTLLLWTGPFLFVVLGAWLLRRRLARPQAAAPELTAAERARAARLLE